jgi:hypothetical protein
LWQPFSLAAAGDDANGNIQESVAFFNLLESGSALKIKPPKKGRKLTRTVATNRASLVARGKVKREARATVTVTVEWSLDIG